LAGNDRLVNVFSRHRGMAAYTGAAATGPHPFVVAAGGRILHDLAQQQIGESREVLMESSWQAK
jgi:hypothetical protein